MVAYRLIVEQWAKAFGEANVTLLHLSERGDVTELLMREGLIPKCRARGARLHRDNAGRDPRVIEVLRQTNQFIETNAHRAASTYFQHRLTDLARTKILRRLDDIARRDPADPSISLMCSDPNLQRSLEDAIAEDEDWLRRHFRLDLRSVSAPREKRALSPKEIESSSSALTKRLGWRGRGWLRVALFARGGALAPVRTD
jgi:hypothetical protein